jgi:hypothetical protein
MPLPKKYRDKYAPKKSGGEVATFFMVKVLGLVVIFLGVGAGIDIYKLIH